jgi:hypothetical protein
MPCSSVGSSSSSARPPLLYRAVRPTLCIYAAVSSGASAYITAYVVYKHSFVVHEVQQYVSVLPLYNSQYMHAGMLCCTCRYIACNKDAVYTCSFMLCA